jgi:hypothetical protein
VVLSELASRLTCFVDDLVKAATQVVQRNDDADTPRQLKKMRAQASAIMDAVKSGALGGRALEEALLTYQQIWDQVQSLEKEARSDSPSSFEEVRYDRAVVEDFLSRLPETLCAHVDLGREFLQQTLERIKIADVGEREMSCPICKTALKKFTPQHLEKHGLELEESYRKFPQLFNRCARVIIKPTAGGLLPTGKLFGLMVAGQRLELSIPG